MPLSVTCWPRWPRAGPWDFVDKFSGPLPAIVIADMLGVPRSDREQFRIWSTTLIQSNPIRGQFGPGLEAAASLYDSLSGFLAERQAHPQDDLMTALVQAEVDGERLDQDVLLGFCLLLLVAGTRRRPICCRTAPSSCPRTATASDGCRTTPSWCRQPLRNFFASTPPSRASRAP